MNTRLIITVVALGLSACGPSAGDGAGAGSAQQPADTLTTAERDSVMAEMPIPGIGGIRDARKAVEATKKRAEAHDTIH